MKRILLTAALSSLAFSAIASDSEFHLFAAKTKEQLNCTGEIKVLNADASGLESIPLKDVLLTLNTDTTEYAKDLLTWAVAKFNVTEADVASIKGTADLQLNGDETLSGIIFDKTFAELKAAGETTLIYAFDGNEGGNSYLASFYPYQVSVVLAIKPVVGDSTEVDVVGLDQSSNAYDLGKFTCVKK